MLVSRLKQYFLFTKWIQNNDNPFHYTESQITITNSKVWVLQFLHSITWKDWVWMRINYVDMINKVCKMPWHTNPRVSWWSGVVCYYSFNFGKTAAGCLFSRTTMSFRNCGFYQLKSIITHLRLLFHINLWILLNKLFHAKLLF